MSNNIKNNKQNSGITTIKWIVVFLLIFVLLGSVVMLGLHAFGIFGKNNSDSNTDLGGGDPADVYVLNPVSSEYVKLLATTASVEPEDENHIVHLTATVEPSTVIDKSVDWNIAFKNPASEWASGKSVTDYVTLTPAGDGALEADVEGLQAFGEQIIITVSSRANPDAFATCTVDYIKRYSIKNILGGYMNNSYNRDEMEGGSPMITSTIMVELESKLGTIEPTNKIYLEYSYSSLVDWVREYLTPIPDSDDGIKHIVDPVCGAEYAETIKNGLLGSDDVHKILEFDSSDNKNFIINDLIISVEISDFSDYPWVGANLLPIKSNIMNKSPKLNEKYLYRAFFKQSFIESIQADNELNRGIKHGINKIFMYMIERLGHGTDLKFNDGSKVDIYHNTFKIWLKSSNDTYDFSQEESYSGDLSASDDFRNLSYASPTLPSYEPDSVSLSQDSVTF